MILILDSWQVNVVIEIMKKLIIYAVLNDACTAFPSRNRHSSHKLSSIICAHDPLNGNSLSFRSASIFLCGVYAKRVRSFESRTKRRKLSPLSTSFSFFTKSSSIIGVSANSWIVNDYVRNTQVSPRTIFDYIPTFFIVEIIRSSISAIMWST